MEITSYLLGKKSSGGGSGSLDWSAIGYDSTPKSIIDGYEFAQELLEDFNKSPNRSLTNDEKNKLIICPLLNTSSRITMQAFLIYCPSLLTIPLLDTNNATSMQSMCNGCTNLRDVEILSTAKVKNMTSAFGGCTHLTNTSLDNILQMCINTSPEYTSPKTLQNVGIASAYYPASTIEALPHYQDFINAGWTIGY